MERDGVDNVETDGVDHFEEAAEFAPYSPWSAPPAPRPSTARDQPGPLGPRGRSGDRDDDGSGAASDSGSGTADGGGSADGSVSSPLTRPDPPAYPLPRRGAPAPPVRNTPAETPDEGRNGLEAAAALVHPYPEIEVPLSYPAPATEQRITHASGPARLHLGRRARDRGVALSAVRRSFGGLRQITVVNPKGDAGKTVATLLLGLTYGQARGGLVLAWDNNEAAGALGMRVQPAMHARTVRDLRRDLDRFASGDRVGGLAAYVWAQHEAMFDVLACAASGEMLTARSFREIREVVSRFYKLIIVDTGNNIHAENWQAAVDATDQLVVTVSARNDSAESAAWLLDHLEQTGRRELVRRAAVIVTMPPHRRDVNPDQIERHFDARCRVVLRVPYDRHLGSETRVRYGSLSPQSRRGWLHAAAAIADGL